ncbi:MAG TPA: DUF1465 family protein [Novosphingobium sp.]|nr:DUF1465 family protein [Novosphingobium sp.]HZV08455.1 DUF1465 family protein [Novosphingobium sp.]
MSQTSDINPRIIETLYAEALVLSDEVRAAFRLAGRLDAMLAAPVAGGPEDAGRIALSCEGLRTTTRVMHALAWLLNHRAFQRGELSESQLRRQGRLPADQPAEPDRLALLPEEVRVLVALSCDFYARLLRLDEAWRCPDAEREGGPGALQERLRRSVA